MADDLDDFFDDIEEVHKEAVEESKDEGKEPELEEPPSKKAKIDQVPAPAPAPRPVPVRPKGMIVAASSSVVLHKKPKENDFVEDELPFSLPPPPPPPPQQKPTLPPLPTGPAPPPPPQRNSKAKQPTKRFAAGKVWVDPTLDEWPENDFRIFCGNLDQSTTDQQLHDHFQKYTSIAKAKIVKDGMGTSKGFGFVSFLAPLDCAKAIREMDQTWLGSRPIRVKRSDWKDRNLNQVMKKNKEEKKKRKRFGL